MSKISTITIYEARVKVKDAILGIITNEYSLVTNLDKSGRDVRVESYSVVEPLYEGDSLRIILLGQLNNAAVQTLITFELTGDSATHVVADYLEGEPILERYISEVLGQLGSNATGADPKTTRPPTTDRLQSKWQKMKPTTRKRYTEASRLYKRLCKDYRREVVDGVSNAPQPTIQDLRTAVVKKMHWQVGDRTLREVLQMKEAGIIK